MNTVRILFITLVILSMSGFDLAWRATQAVAAEPLCRTPQQQADLEARLRWFHEAKYGIMFHFVPSMLRFREPAEWTSAEWSAHVDQVDVERVAAQAEEIGAGYVILSIGQKGDYYCSPNPVYERQWGFQENQFSSRRDLPMDLHRSLQERGIRVMFYVTAAPFAGPCEASRRNGWPGDGGRKYPDRAAVTAQGREKWIESLQWWSDHYGERASGWWVDGLKGYADGYDEKLIAALRHGNPQAIVTSARPDLSDFLHGHCVHSWKAQQKRLPTDGRWDAEYGVQWHAFQYLGGSWAGYGAPHSTASLVNYAVSVIRGGGVITFDVGTFKTPWDGPHLFIPADQMKQLCAVRDAVAKLDPNRNGAR